MYLQFIDLENFNQYDSLPVKIRLADGSTRTSLFEYTSDQLAGLGLYHYTEATHEYNSFTHHTTSNCTFNHESRTFVREIVPYDESTIKQQLINAIQVYLDNEAKAHYYDGILSLCSYATSINPKFGPEGQAGVVWRDACWSVGYAVLAECEAGTRTIPTVDELLAEMPVMVWP
jgi:hypothetical protein